MASASEGQWPVYNPIDFPEDSFGATGMVEPQHNPAAGPGSMGSGRSTRGFTRKSKQQTRIFNRVPQLDTPQRIEPPAAMRPPQRRPVQTRNEAVSAAFKPESMQRSKGKYDISSYGGGPVSPQARRRAASNKSKRGPRGSGEGTIKGLRENFGEIKTKLRDLQLLAQCCRRAEKLQKEGEAYFCSGVLYDNMGQMKKAIQQYKSYVGVCQQTNDVAGAALAFNCIGVNYITLGSGTEESRVEALAAQGAGSKQQQQQQQPLDADGGEAAAARVASLQRAVEFHGQHLHIADERGQFVAHCNLGIANDRLGDFDQAARHHQDALRLAIQLQSSHGQCIAVGNLGLVAIRQGDLATARACLDQHLQLVRSLRDPSAEASACHYLGLLSNMQGEFAQAARFFDEARQLARECGETGIMKLAACSFGMAQANMRLESHMNSVVEKATSPQKRK